MHVEQFQRYGFLRFLILYVIEFWKAGYWDNKFEVEARAREGETALLEQYEILP